MMPFTWSRGMLVGALEVHVLDPVRDAGQAGTFVLRADLVPAPHRRQRRGVLFLDQHLQAVVERRRAKGVWRASAEVAISSL